LTLATNLFWALFNVFLERGRKNKQFSGSKKVSFPESLLLLFIDMKTSFQTIPAVHFVTMVCIAILLGIGASNINFCGRCLAFVQYDTASAPTPIIESMIEEKPELDSKDKEWYKSFRRNFRKIKIKFIKEYYGIIIK